MCKAYMNNILNVIEGQKGRLEKCKDIQFFMNKKTISKGVNFLLRDFINLMWSLYNPRWFFISFCCLLVCLDLD